MRDLGQNRLPLNGSTRATATRANRACAVCERGPDAHLHCMVCCAPMEISAVRKTCSAECRALFKHLRRCAKSARYWVTLDDGTRLRVWLPKRLLVPLDTTVSRS